MEVSDQLHKLAAATAGDKIPGIHWKGGCMDSKVSLEAWIERKLSTFLGISIVSLNCPSDSLVTEPTALSQLTIKKSLVAF
jgi:hypothetical protein